MAILLLAEHDNITLSEQTAKALTAAHAIGGDVHVLVAGANAAGVAQQAAQLDGVARILLADAVELANGLAEPTADIIVSIAAAYDTIIAPA
ncbi:MAG: electron transfer flavoprotein subunit alpha/FixB family protein, partial [Devosia sp.]|nr:electron transfer flavoprotein subunit alpha/FixB family protein [Devosia sp.]